ncbi:hypothetical protein [Lysinibacillus parviboronicapiens]
MLESNSYKEVEALTNIFSHNFSA